MTDTFSRLSVEKQKELREQIKIKIGFALESDEGDLVRDYFEKTTGLAYEIKNDQLVVPLFPFIYVMEKLDNSGDMLYRFISFFEGKKRDIICKVVRIYFEYVSSEENIEMGENASFQNVHKYFNDGREKTRELMNVIETMNQYRALRKRICAII